MNPAANRQQSHDQRYYGVASGLVVDDADPGKEGRVKISLPWFNPDYQSEWCRVVQPYAGNGYGFCWVPEVGDEVLVSFVLGNLAEPIVIGGLYNGQDLPPTARDAATDEKLVRTKAGHELRMIDTPGREQVEVRTKGGHSIKLDDTGQNVKIETSTGTSVELSASGVTVTASASVSVNAPSVSIGQGASLSLVLGEALMALFNAHVHTCTAPATPSSPPVTPMTPAVFSTVIKVI